MPSDDQAQANALGRPVSLLENLGRKHGTSKLGGDYLRRYAALLDSRRSSVRNVLEIGVEDGHSLGMWREYFPDAAIHGVDIDPNAKSHEGERVKVWVADSTDRAQMEEVVQGIGGPIQLIIDDGSHHPFDQIATFKTLFPHLASGGFYFVEDVGGTRGPLRSRALKAFMELAEGLNYWPKNVSAYHAPRMAFDVDNYWIKHVVGISFFRYLVIVEKGHNPTDNIYLSNDQPRAPVTPRPRVRLARLRELPWPWYRSRRHFVSKSEVRPEGVVRLGLRFLFRRW